MFVLSKNVIRGLAKETCFSGMNIESLCHSVCFPVRLPVSVCLFVSLSLLSLSFWAAAPVGDEVL